MNDEHRQLLRQKREKFLRDLDAKRAASKLYSRGIFSEEDKDEVNAKKTNYQQREEVLDILPRKGPKAFLVFCDILHEISEHLEAELRPVQEEEKCTENTDGSLDKEPLAAARSPTGESNIQNHSVEDDLDVDGLFKFGSYNLNKASKQLNTATMYKMTSTPRGIAVIISNKNFLESSGQHFSSREGTEVDREALKRLFKILQFKVEIYNNQTKAGIRRIAVEMAAFDHSKYDAFIFAVLSHGREGVVYGTDDIIPIRDITSSFTQCRSLAGKPKIFFFQACQGDAFMDGLDIPDAPLQHADNLSVPVEADFIYAYSTVPGYYAWRNSTEGSWFIKSVVKVFGENAYNMEILQMLTRVNNLISTYKSRHPIAPDKRQVSTTVSMLTKDLYFFPQRYK
ncbi:caspase-3-like isoform X1 [Acropora muricata]|uniref:caspase-3-like isoform X1 n=1 Tax=Acropora muricata TaxID=159855 RepID=UPI0034E42DA2